MSSFVGLLHLDGAPCAPEIIEAMLARLSHRVTLDGARRASVRVAGPVGLGCAVLPTTPQARLELENPDAHQTLRQGNAQLWIAGDVRLDNRVEIIGVLGAENEARAWSDGRLVLAAYEKWGEDSVARLRGDFAYAIWDARRQRLFCARDGFGVKPFYYAHLPGKLFAFANELKALWGVPGLDAGVNPFQIADYLAGQFRDKTSTFYRSVRRLSPACWTTLSPTEDASSHEVREQLYWRLDGEGELDLPGDARARDAGYADLVREAFGESLRQRMRCDGKLATFLSGGLDSSCMAALAERLASAEQKPLTAFSTVFERFAQCDESAWIDQTLARGEFEPLRMNGDAISPVRELDRILWHLDGPTPGANVCSAWAQYGLLQQAGVSVVMDGHGGDEIIFKAYERVGELLYGGQLATAWREMRLLKRHGLMEGAPGGQMWGALLWHARDKRGLGRLTRPLRARHVRRAREADMLAELDALSLGVVTPACLELLNDSPKPPLRSTRAHHVREIEGAIQPLALESLDAMGGAHAIEVRCPFWEQKLAQLCVSLPADQKLREGYNRYVMRRAMEGILAPEVQWRRGKTDFGPQVTTLLREEEGPRFEAFFEMWENAATGLERSGLTEFIDLENARAQWHNLQNRPLGSLEAALPAIVLWKVFSVGTWLAAQPSASAPPPAPK